MNLVLYFLGIMSKKRLLIFIIATALFLSACVNQAPIKKHFTKGKKMIQNEKMRNFKFLDEMLQDDYYPKHLVEKGVVILKNLCKSIEDNQPKTLDELYKLTHAATEEFNDLAQEFEDNDSEYETVAREATGADFETIAKAYGFEADVEELIAPRDW
jgi:hypothetical protein